MALLLRLITEDSGHSRADLAKRTGLTKATVSGLVGELIDAGLVHETGRRDGERPGRPASWLAPDPLGPVGIGIALREDRVLGCLTDLSATALAREGKATESAEPRAARPVLRKLFDTATSAGRFVAGVHLAVAPEAVGEQLEARLRAELTALGAPGIEAATGVEFEYAARAESRVTPGQVLYLGGESALGAVMRPEASTGELSHVQIRRRGERCTCGERGCLLSYADRAGVRERPEQASEALCMALRPLLTLTGQRPVLLGGWLRALPAEPLSTQLGVPVHAARLGTDAAARGAADAALAHIREQPADWLAD